MDIDQKGVEEFEILGRELNEIYLNTIEHAQKAQSKVRFKINENENKCSRDNLLCYLALREHDLSDLQLRLDEQGLSSLGMLESHVLVSIEHVLKHFGITPTNTGSLCKALTTKHHHQASPVSSSLPPSPVLLLYAPINRFHIMDISPDRSVVRQIYNSKDAVDRICQIQEHGSINY